jgi:hypothetical protein
MAEKAMTNILFHFVTPSFGIFKIISLIGIKNDIIDTHPGKLPSRHLKASVKSE